MTTLCADPPPVLLPPRRLGAALARARAEVGWSAQDVVAALRGRVDERELAAVEAGSEAADDALVRLLAAVYGLTVEALVPQRARLVIDPDEPAGCAGAWWVGVGEAGGARRVLVRYLAFVYAIRGLKPGRFLVPRAADLAVLATYLDRTPDDVRRALEELMATGRDEVGTLSSSLRSRAVLPGVGFLVAASAVGALLLVSGADAADASRAEQAPVGVA